MAVTWIKAKYARPKSLSGNRSKHNDGTRRKLKRKVSDAMKKRLQAEQPRVTLVVKANGKKIFRKESK